MTMRLLASPTSPYARLVRVVLAEKRLLEKIQVEMVDPWSSPHALLQVNPLSRIPTLVTEHGVPLTESALIALYLEHAFAEPVLIPSHSLESVMRRLGLSQGILDAAVAVVANRRFRGEEADADPIVARRLAALPALLAKVEEVAGGDPAAPDLGDLALVVALEYVEFRLPELGWTERQPVLTGWWEARRERPSLAGTRPA